ncbi:MAG: DNA polymerase III subunit delta [Cyanobacteria bacterium]|nr:DNA polymerase III subunit delta [Cyanobacteriota bacterium]
MTVYVFYGDDEFLRQQALKKLRETHVDPAFAALCHRQIQSPAVHELLEAVQSGSLALGGDTLLEVHQCSLLHESPKGSADAAWIESLMETLKDSLSAMAGQANPAKHLVFVNEKLDRKYKFPKWLVAQPFVQVHEFASLPFWKQDDMAHWLVQAAKSQDILISQDAAALLVDITGMDRRLLMSEVEKLSVFTAGKAIGPQDVMLLANHPENVFEMLGLWLQGKTPVHVFDILENLLLRKYPIELMALIQSHLSQMFRIKLWHSLGYSDADIAAQTQKKPFKIQKDREALLAVSLSRLKKLKEEAIRLEIQSKQGALDARLALEMLLAQ